MTDLSLTFYGVRGSMPCPDPDYMRYGGNTSCLLLQAGDTKLILDAGTGLRKLSEELEEAGYADRLNILLTHTHGDHIAGLPFLSQAYRDDRAITFHAGHLLPDQRLEPILHKLMAPPFFPISPTAFKADIQWNDFTAGEDVKINDLTIQTAALNHPNGATGYRFSAGNKSICYVTDTEHTPGKPDQNILRLIKGADLVVYDSTYSDETFANFKGWGHSTWQEGVRLCQAAGVKKLAIFHHNPQHADKQMDAVAAEAKQLWDGAIVAKEGMTLAF